MKPEKRVIAVIVACVVVIVASIVTWHFKPVQAKMKPCDTEFTMYIPTQDGDVNNDRLKVLHDNKFNRDYILYNGKIILRAE